MNKKIALAVLLIVTVLLILSIVRNIRVQSNSQVSGASQQKNSDSTPSPQKSAKPADKIEIVHFHGTVQCPSCITVGEYALKTIKEKFPEEYNSGKIVFKDINGELKENRDIVIKYKARGSSLFVNAIRDGEDDISEDVVVWRLVNNEARFVSYFEDKLKSLLGK